MSISNARINLYNYNVDACDWPMKISHFARFELGLKTYFQKLF